MAGSNMEVSDFCVVRYHDATRTYEACVQRDNRWNW